ncbi:MAG: tetratricopeptide repeat protein [Clostridiaceae bacterium]|nr:tetratricopeptide repeat protein [Clostridiaceae bacterium]
MKLKADDIAGISGHQQIAYNVELITKRIREYYLEEDINALEKLRDLCKNEGMMIEAAKMHRNIGMYHFYMNNCSNAVKSMKLAIDTVRREDCLNLLVEYYSELGYMYFYNHEYIRSVEYYEKAEELLLQVSEMGREISYLHYYRYGILLSNMQDYYYSEQKLKNALLYSGDDKDTALIIMNIGLLFKRQKDFKAALRYYSKALCLADQKDMRVKSKVYNNIAIVYKILGQYKKALSYIDKAFKCIEDDDMAMRFICFNTYTEIKLLMGEKESVLDDFLELLLKVEDIHLYKGYIIQGISNMIVIGSEDRKILKRLENTIIKLIKGNTYENKEYIKELKVCLADIRLCLRDFKRNLKDSKYAAINKA